MKTKEKTYKTLQVRPNTHQRVMLFKIRCKAKDADEVVKMALHALKEMYGVRK